MYEHRAADSRAVDVSPVESLAIFDFKQLIPQPAHDTVLAGHLGIVRDNQGVGRIAADAHFTFAERDGAPKKGPAPPHKFRQVVHAGCSSRISRASIKSEVPRPSSYRFSVACNSRRLSRPGPMISPRRARLISRRSSNPRHGSFPGHRESFPEKPRRLPQVARPSQAEFAFQPQSFGEIETRGCLLNLARVSAARASSSGRIGSAPSHQ